MARYNERRLSYRKQDELIKMFSVVLSKLDTPPSIFNFLKDILNRQERLMLIRRLLIAEMLLDDRTYEQIHIRLGAGMTTIARVQRWLRFGRGGLVRAILAKRKK